MVSRAKFWPVFTCAHAVAVILMFSWSVYHAGVPSPTFSPVYHTMTDRATLRGPQEITFKEPSNPLMAQPAFVLIRLGALFPPCMRTDYRIRFHYSVAMGDKLLSGEDRLGCCEVPSLNIAATVTKESCISNNLTMWRPTRCSERKPGDTYIAHALRPCCTGTDGTCDVTSAEHCWFVGGVFHQNAEHCYQVNCMQTFCRIGMSPTEPTYRETPSLPPSYHQWWRFLTAIYLPLGMVDWMVLFLAELPFSWNLERNIGWLRVLLVHTSAGATGHLVGSLLSKFNEVLSGGGPSFAGILAASMVHHMDVWGIKPRLSVYTAAWSTCLILLLLLGTLPRLSDHANFWGFIVGFLLAAMYVPFHWTKRVVLVRTVCAVILVLSVMFSLIIFYEIQPSVPCRWCNYFDCLPYVSGMCE